MRIETKLFLRWIFNVPGCTHTDFHICALHCYYLTANFCRIKRSVASLTGHWFTFLVVLSLICLVTTQIIICENYTIWRPEILLRTIVAALLKTKCSGRFVENIRYQKTSKEYFTIMQMIVKGEGYLSFAARATLCPLNPPSVPQTHTQTRIHTWIHAYMHTCIHAYMHTCIHAYMHTCIHAYMHTCIHAYMHTCIHAYMHTCIHAYMHTCIHAYMHTCIHAYMHTCIHAYMHTCIHAYMHTCIHAYMHTCIHAYMHTYITYIHTVPTVHTYFIKAPWALIKSPHFVLSIV